MTALHVISPVKEKTDTESIIIGILQKEKMPIEISELLSRIVEIDIMAEFEFRPAIIRLLSKGIVVLDNNRRISFINR